MRRLFLLSMAFMFFGSVVIIGWFAMMDDDVYIFVVFIGGSGAIPFGVMLVKHVRDIFRK